MMLWRRGWVAAGVQRDRDEEIKLGEEKGKQKSSKRAGVLDNK